MKQILELRDSQSGVAGEAGTITRIHPDGSFTVARFLNDRIEQPHWRGLLSREALAALAKVLSEQRFSTLPRTLGTPPRSNARVIAVTLGDRTTTLLLETGTNTAASVAAAPQSPKARLLAIARTVDALTAGG